MPVPTWISCRSISARPTIRRRLSVLRNWWRADRSCSVSISRRGCGCFVDSDRYRRMSTKTNHPEGSVDRNRLGGPLQKQPTSHAGAQRRTRPQSGGTVWNPSARWTIPRLCLLLASIAHLTMLEGDFPCRTPPCATREHQTFAPGVWGNFGRPHGIALDTRGVGSWLFRPM
jgi:hypothetical protein